MHSPFFVLYPHDFKKGTSFCSISSNLATNEQFLKWKAQPSYSSDKQMIYLLVQIKSSARSTHVTVDNKTIDFPNSSIYTTRVSNVTFTLFANYFNHK